MPRYMCRRQGRGSLLESVPCGVLRTELRSSDLTASSVTSAESSYCPLPCLFETGSTQKYPGCPGISLLMEDDSELLIFLSPPPDFWDYNYTGTHLVYARLGLAGTEASTLPAEPHSQPTAPSVGSPGWPPTHDNPHFILPVAEITGMCHHCPQEWKCVERDRPSNLHM